MPPNVEECSPFDIAPIISGLASVAPIGTPPAMPFARHSMSGATPQCWQAHSFPVLPSPACISSNTSRAPRSSHMLRASCRNPGGATCMPLSPWMGSMMTNAVSSSTAWRRASASPNGVNSAPSMRGSNGLRYFGPNVIERAPSDFPWYEPFMAIIFLRPVYFFANFIAASTASAPLLLRCTCL